MKQCKSKEPPTPKIFQKYKQLFFCAGGGGGGGQKSVPSPKPDNKQKGLKFWPVGFRKAKKIRVNFAPKTSSPKQKQRPESISFWGPNNLTFGGPQLEVKVEVKDTSRWVQVEWFATPFGSSAHREGRSSMYRCQQVASSQQENVSVDQSLHPAGGRKRKVKGPLSALSHLPPPALHHRPWYFQRWCRGRKWSWAKL